MADILPFKKPASKKKPTSVSGNKSGSGKKAADKKGSGHTLCKAGFHKWKVDKSAAFAVKEGKLLTRYICERCGQTKIETT